MIVIYALRSAGDTEVRYIGRSGRPLDQRLQVHKQNAFRQNYPPKVSAWIREAGDIEIVPLARCTARLAAKREREWVERYHALGHRLTNSHLVPRGRAA